MKKNKRWSVEQKLTITLKHLNDEQSMNSLAHEYGCSQRLIGSWVEKYNTLGVKGLKRKGQNKIYTPEQKEKMIHVYVNFKVSHRGCGQNLRPNSLGGNLCMLTMKN